MCIRDRDSIAEPLRTHNRMGTKKLDPRVLVLPDEVGLSRSHATRLPRHLWVVKRQRGVNLRALSTRPKLRVLYEPTSPLDMSVQVQIRNLL